MLQQKGGNPPIQHKHIFIRGFVVSTDDPGAKRLLLPPGLWERMYKRLDSGRQNRPTLARHSINKGVQKNALVVLLPATVPSAPASHTIYDLMFDAHVLFFFFS